MGKKKYKKAFDKMPWYDQQEFLMEQADNYNIPFDDYSQFHSKHGRHASAAGTYEDLEKAIAQASYNNFSNRTALQEAALQGNDHAERILSMNEGINQTAAAERWMEKQHDKHVGGGAYTWGSDPAAVAQHFAQKSRDALLAAAGKQDNPDVSQDASDFSSTRAYELSPELSAAIERNEAFQQSRLDGNIFQPIFEDPVESEPIAQGILQAEAEERNNRENDFLFKYIENMNLA